MPPPTLAEVPKVLCVAKSESDVERKYMTGKRKRDGEQTVSSGEIEPAKLCSTSERHCVDWVGECQESSNIPLSNNFKRQEAIFSTIEKPVRTALSLDGRLVDCKKYSHQPLREGEIRLLRLGKQRSQLQDPETDHLLPTAEIVHFRLDKTPRYRAISYVWGSPYETEPIFIYPHQFLTTTRNLVQALRSLRQHCNTIQYFWADQLCIDQTNFRERASQVGMMLKIYAKATSCVAWLGQSDENTSLAFEVISQVRNAGFILTKNQKIIGGRQLLDDRKFLESPFERSTLEIDDVARRALLCILNRELFSRQWVLQEIVIPDIVHFKCGPYTCTQNELHSAVFYLASIHIDPSRSYPPGLYNCFAVDRLRGLKSANLSLLTLLFESRGRYECSDPHDRVYALLGLGSIVEDVLIFVDYTEPVTDLYTRVTRAMINTYGSLRVLGALGDEGSDETVNLPSWTPNWSIKGNGFPIEPLSALSGSTTPCFRSSRLYRHIPRPTVSTSQLVVRGKVIDTVRNIISDFVTEQDFNSEDSAVPHLETIIFRVLPWLRKFKISSFSAERVLIEVITAIEHPPHPQAKEQWTRELLINDAAKMLDALENFIQMGESSYDQPHEIKSWLRQLARHAQVCVNRKFTMTKRYIVMCPKDCREGDLVCILHGSNVPLLIRTQDQYYKTIGQCYAYGIMNGEAVNWKEAEADTFTLI